MRQDIQSVALLLCAIAVWKIINMTAETAEEGKIVAHERALSRAGKLAEDLQSVALPVTLMEKACLARVVETVRRTPDLGAMFRHSAPYTGEPTTAADLGELSGGRRCYLDVVPGVDGPMAVNYRLG